jgi:hypothetical protein
MSAHDEISAEGLCFIEAVRRRAGEKSPRHKPGAAATRLVLT